MVEVVVEYEYDALNDDELTLKLGDVIKNARRIEEEGWMEGDLNGRRGLFPDNFVKEVRKEPKEEPKDVAKEAKEESHVTRRSAGNVASLVQRISTYGIPTGGLGLQPHSQPRTVKIKPKKRQCKALFDYVPQNEDELELKVGDIIDITEEVEEGWWSGTMNGKAGLFPSNFVKEIETSEDGEMNDVADDPENKDESGTSTSPHHGNGIIAQPKKVKGVGFGDIFREGSVKLKVRLPSENEEKKEKPIPSLPSTAKPTHLTTTTTDSGKAEGESKTKVKEYCKATYAYEATNQDELDLKEGDIIQILSKDTGESGWWRGECNGKEGVFPDNFVTLISETEKEAVAFKGSVPKLSPRQEADEKPKKPSPPSKSTALKPDVPSADKKPLQPRPDDKGEKTVPEHKPSKTAPLVPPKKPVPPPGKRPGSMPPKRPDKPGASSLGAKSNGEVPPIRPKSEFEPTISSKPKTLSGDWGEKSSDVVDLMSFDDVSSATEKLSHLTVNRPKMPGRRLPGQFGGTPSPSKENVEKSLKGEEEVDVAKLKTADIWKPSVSTPSPAVHQRAAASPGAGAAPARGPSPEPKLAAAAEGEGEKGAELEGLRTQMKELLLTVELLRTQQTRELSDLRNELEEEKLRRVSLQMEIEKLKKMVQTT